MEAEELALRRAAFTYLGTKCRSGSEDTVTWAELKNFIFQEETVHLIGASGIWKPAALSLPISITTAPPRSGRPAPYEDEITDDGLLRYQYQGPDPMHHRNVGLRKCMQESVPLIYLTG